MSDFLQKHEITIHGPTATPYTTFEDAELNKYLPEAVKQSFKAQKFKVPTPIQAVSWPYVLKGKDLIGIAKTGSGKTLAYGIPAVNKIVNAKPLNPSVDGPLALVLAPTRELAQQIQVEIEKVLPPNMSSTCVYGGVPKQPQIDALWNGTHVVVATPGRLLDLLEAGATDLKRIEFLVFDEADRMLDLGFEPAIRAICKQAPPADSRQTLMFSATWPDSVRALAAEFQRKDEVVRVMIGGGDEKQLTANANVRMHFTFVSDPYHKLREATQLLDKYRGKRIILFALYKKSVNFLEQRLRGRYNIAPISSDKSQQVREQMLAKFRKEDDCILVATDVAARGLDVKNVAAVINYEFPLQADDFVHRIGRTGRAGASGDAHTILADKEDYFDGFAAKAIEGLLKEAGQPCPRQITQLADTVRHQIKPVNKKKEEKVPDMVPLSAASGNKATKFADSSDDEDEVDTSASKKRGRE